MTEAEQTARAILGELQDCVAANDLDALSGLFADDVVLFGTASAQLDREETLAYLGLVVAQEGTIRWAWDTVVPLVDEPGHLAFAVVGSVGFEDVDGSQMGERDAFRLTCVAIEREGRWRLRHFHGSVPQPG